ncbi:4-hydroxy-2-oxoglutarate aldolase [Gracilibacillus boraciitolerans JCM 21714]|uniref:4-hydroxy-2-oxoglutarate aldolase n=1 Tax=Gracilibacillus boraciitolerans JCM 21714 TaxID=1298598 RepID=W4VHD9_9BACI|nr:4-hydroxy-2-oxoglutarate aldolase [Gracilibacillus boraciitolerans JCM 21714]
METLQKMYKNKLVAIMRGVPKDHVLDVAQALYEGGIRTLEITVDSPNVLQAIELVRDKFADEMIVGAGTVLDAETARSAIMADPSLFFLPR